MKQTTLTTATTLILASLTPVHSWAVSFYTGLACNNDTQFNNTNYGGKGNGDCHLYTDNAQGKGNCTAVMNPKPQSAYIPKGTACCIGYWNECTYDKCYTKEKCINLRKGKEWETQHNDSWGVTFRCFDKKKKD
ncbi:hypothetical protein AC579_7934 [Pseudocercospora musae]|uniref:Uncharacterized protein n=1 Tax=Pseudocercospora musae TaxID=113226 RepID=A0A139IKV2_9PEZI|nr:hypothetical protein AC579_7934 [Pseudocercospora musae]